MESCESLSSLTYKGSILEAFLEAKNQKKLFVAYISCEDAESKNMDDSTWTDLKVKELLSKYCILLHIRGGSSDAAKFSVIYPQKCVPCITLTAIGHNRVQAWQCEGFVSAEVLAASLEKAWAWLSLHIQETKATVLSSAEAEKAMQREKDKGIDDREGGVSENTATANIQTFVRLNIRLPDSSSLQEKFPVAHTLRMVKDYVDRNRSSGMGSYDLAIPCPRKLFGDQDLSKSLLDLGLPNGQAVIVVPRERTCGFQRQRSLSANRSIAAYFACIMSFLSYINPFSCLGGGASSSTTGLESQSRTRENSPNPTRQNNLGKRDSSYSPHFQNRSTSTGRDEIRNRRPTTSRYGSNIHTLQRNEDTKRNPIRKGNSAQNGGNSNRK